MPEDEAKLHSAKERGMRAAQLLNDELMQEAFKTLEATYTRAWAATEPHDTEGRENYWKALQILSDVHRHLKKTAENGRLVQRELDNLALKLRPRAI